MLQPVPAVLREVHRLRRHMRELQAEVDRVPRVLKAHQQKVAKLEQALKDAQDALKKLKAHVMERESTMKSTNQQIAKYEKQNNDVSNKKEFDAIQSEIAHAQGVRQQIEEEILAGMMESDERAAKLPEFEAALKKGREELAAFEKDMGERVARLKEESARAKAELVVHEAKVPATVRQDFDRLIKAFGADAFAGVKERTCQQCNTSITIQNESELLKGEFVTCKSCARGLYPID